MVKRIRKVMVPSGLLALSVAGPAAWAPPAASPAAAPSVAPDIASAVAESGASGVAPGAPGGGAPVEVQTPEAPQGRSLPVDRWLVSDPFPVEEAETGPEAPAAEPLDLEAGPDPFPDRDVELAGAYWHLVRRDSVATLDLDSLFPERPPRAVAYAHTYLRSPGERTLRLRWRAPDCGAAGLRLNGEPLVPAVPPSGPEGAAEDGDAGRAMLVRLAAGWNTLLARVAAGDCPYRLEVRFEEADALDAGGDGARAGPGALEGVRVQASRPPGVRRTYPAAFVTAGEAAVGEPLRWPAEAEALTGDLLLELAAWGAPPAAVAGRRGEERPDRERGPPALPGEARDPERERLARLRERLLPSPPPPEPAPGLLEVRVKAGGAEIRRTVELDGTGRARKPAFPFSFQRLDRAARSREVEVELRWRTEGDDRRLRGRLPLPPDAPLRRLRGPVELVGWDAAGEAARRGEWRVPPALADLTLEVSTEAAPGRWTVNGEEAPPGRPVRLCGPCREGTRLRLEVTPSAEWASPPRVRAVEGDEEPEATPGG